MDDSYPSVIIMRDLFYVSRMAKDSERWKLNSESLVVGASGGAHCGVLIFGLDRYRF